MMNLTILATAIMAGITLLIGMSILIYQHYRYRRKSIDWGDIERYDTPLELLPPGSNNSSFRSYKYSQLVAKQDQSTRKYSTTPTTTATHSPYQRQSVGSIEGHNMETRRSRSSTKSCPPGVFTFPAQEFRVKQEQQWVQPYYYYRQIVVDPSVTKKTRHSLPEVVSKYNTNFKNTNINNNISSSSSNVYGNCQSYLYPVYNPTYNLASTSNATSSSTPPQNLDLHYDRLSPSRRGSTNKRKLLQRKYQNQHHHHSHQQQQNPNYYQKPNPPDYEEEPGGTSLLISREVIPGDWRSHNRGQNRFHSIPNNQSHQNNLLGVCPPHLLLLKEIARSEESCGGWGEGFNMLTHQSRSVPSTGPIPGARLNRTYSISSQGHIENAVRKGHRGSSPAIRTYNPEGFSFDVSSPPDSPPATYTGSRSPSPALHGRGTLLERRCSQSRQIRAASLDIHRSGSPCPDLRGTSPLGESNFHISATQHSSHSMDSYPSGKAPMLSPNSLCVRRASRCLSPLFIPPTSPKSPADGNSSGSQPSSTGPLSPMLGSLQLDLYLKKDVTIFLDAHQRITNLTNESNNKSKNAGEFGVISAYSPTLAKKSNGHGSLGRLHFRLKYDMDKSDLHLHVIEAHDLAKGDQGGFNDPYIRVFISPEVDTRKRETSIHRNESDPFFDEHFKFPVSQEDLKEKILILQVLDFDKYSRKDVVGEVSFTLDEFDITTNLEVWAEIVKNKKPSGEKQEILISLSYLPSAERLTVVLLKARNLHTPENKDTIDPFVKVYLLGGGKRQKKKKTTARKNSNNPVWNEAFTFPIAATNLAKGSIEISVLDQSNDLMGSHALIGSCMIGPHQNGSELKHWTEMNHNLRQTITMWHVLT